MNEHFDPCVAKLVLGRISGMGTPGGLAGGVVAAWMPSSAVVLALAILNLACAWVLWRGFRSTSAKEKTERDRPKQNRNQFQTDDDEEDNREQHLQRAGALTLGGKQLLHKSDRTQFPKRPDNPAGEEDQAMASVRLTSALAPRNNG